MERLPQLGATHQGQRTREESKSGCSDPESSTEDAPKPGGAAALGKGTAQSPSLLLHRFNLIQSVRHTAVTPNLPDPHLLGPAELERLSSSGAPTCSQEHNTR